MEGFWLSAQRESCRSVTQTIWTGVCWPVSCLVQPFNCKSICSLSLLISSRYTQINDPAETLTESYVSVLLQHMKMWGHTQLHTSCFVPRDCWELRSIFNVCVLRIMNSWCLCSYIHSIKLLYVLHHDESHRFELGCSVSPQLTGCYTSCVHICPTFNWANRTMPNRYSMANVSAY